MWEEVKKKLERLTVWEASSSTISSCSVLLTRNLEVQEILQKRRVNNGTFLLRNLRKSALLFFTFA